MSIDWDGVQKLVGWVLTALAAIVSMLNWRQLRANANKTESEAAQAQAAAQKISADAEMVRVNVAKQLEEISAHAIQRLSDQLRTANVELERLRTEIAEMQVELDTLAVQHSQVAAERDHWHNVARALSTQLQAQGIKPLHEVK